MRTVGRLAAEGTGGRGGGAGDKHRDAGGIDTDQIELEMGGIGEESGHDKILNWEATITSLSSHSIPVTETAGEPEILTVYNDHQMIFHGGGNPGFQSYNRRFPEDGVDVVILTNNENNSLPLVHTVEQMALGLR